MLARIKFVSSSNKVTRDELDILENFLGEKISVSQMKIGSDGEISSLSWRETFDKEKVEKDNDYTLVQPSNYYQITDSNNFIVELEKFTSKFPSLEITIKGVPKSIGTDYSEVMSMMNEVASKIEEAKNRFDKVVEFNQKCEVHVPNLGLLSINRLAYATNYCTEALQGLLLKGWRIIAVCPQPDQRRPDYILGMSITGVNDDVSVEWFEGEGREYELRVRDKMKAE